jgi:hypothetical protein
VTAHPTALTRPATLVPGPGILGAQADAERPHRVRLAGHEMPGTAVNSSGNDLDQDLVGAHGRRRYVPVLQHLGGAQLELPSRFVLPTALLAAQRKR